MAVRLSSAGLVDQHACGRPLQDDGRRTTMSAWQFRVPEQVGQYTKQKPLHLSSLSLRSHTASSLSHTTFQGSYQYIHTQGQGTRPHLSMNCRCILKLLQSSLWPQTLTCFLHEKYTPSQDPSLWHQAQVRLRLLVQDFIIIKSCPYQVFAIGNSMMTLNLGSVSSAECQELICKLKWEFYFGWGKNGRDWKKHWKECFNLLQITYRMLQTIKLKALRSPKGLAINEALSNAPWISSHQGII